MSGSPASSYDRDLDIPEPRRPDECPVEDWLAFLGHRWNALILWHLKEGEKRYGDLSTLLPGVSPKVLSERLDNLVARGLVLRRPVFRFPRGVDYGLTPKARELIAILDQLEVWSRQDEHGAPD